jgi:GNAT superfamily N-acetyltransferase
VAYAGPVILTGDHVLDGFDCGKPALDEWLRNRALTNRASGASRTWIVVEESSSDVVAYYASSTASILRSAAPTRLRKNQPEQVPAILLARMAVDQRHTGKGLGAALLKHFMLKAFEVAQSVGVRVLLIHAKDDEAKDFYSHYGFVESPFDPLTLVMLLGDIGQASDGGCRANASKRMSQMP